MKIEKGPFQEISQLEPYKQKVLAGRFYNCKRTFIVKADDAYLAVTFTIFERLKAAFLKIVGKNYFRDVFKAKKVIIIPNSEVAKLVPISGFRCALPPDQPALKPAKAGRYTQTNFFC